MSNYIRYLLIVTGLNIVSIILFCVPVFFDHRGQYDSLGWLVVGLILTSISFFVQFIVALVFLNNEKKRSLGQAMLTFVGLAVLIGFSICTGM